MATIHPPEPNQEHFLRLLKQFHTAMLVTHAGTDKLRGRPMAVAKVEDDSRVWFLSAEETAKTHEIESDTRVHLIYQSDRDAYLSVSGYANLVHDRAKIAELWSEPYRVWFPEGKDDPSIVLIEVRPEEAEYWDNQGGNKISYLFETAKAYVTGSTPKIHESEQHGVVQL